MMTQGIQDLTLAPEAATWSKQDMSRVSGQGTAPAQHTQPTMGRLPSGRRPGMLSGKKCRWHKKASPPNDPAVRGGAEDQGLGSPLAPVEEMETSLR